MFELESKEYDIFISHTGGKEEEYSTFEDKLQSAHDFEYKNYSQLEEDKITEESIESQINPVGAVIILSGLYNKYKNIIQKQIDIAVKLDKPIIVIRPFGMEDIPPELEKISVDVIGWNAPCIVDAIEENYQN